MPLTGKNFYQAILVNTVERSTHLSLSDWYERFVDTTKECSSTLEQAAMGGKLSLNAGFAFAAGYQSAIQSLFQPETRQLSSLCVTEQLGNHPRALKCTLTKEGQNWLLDGSKSFVTGAEEAEFLYIAAVIDQNPQAKATIKMLALNARKNGTHIKTMPALPFIPEISHGSATFKQVKIAPDNILPGDGYSDYVKPFRTHEDIHVLSAITGFRLGEALNYNWPNESIEAHLALLSNILSLKPSTFNHATTHLILAGCRTQFKKLIAETDPYFKQSNPEGYEKWKKDKALLKIANKAHEVRTARAWTAMKKAP